MKLKINEWIKLLVYAAVFTLCYFLPVHLFDLQGPALEAAYLVRWYAREHVLLCLIPAFFIAGAIAVFVSQASVIKYFGAKANKFLSYGVASVSGAIMAVCSCTILPLFSGIYKRGAGLGPATAFLYSGPAINILAIIMTARVLGFELGLARAIGAILFSIVIGFLMHLIFIKEERQRQEKGMFQQEQTKDERQVWKTVLYMSSMVGILVFANWAAPGENDTGLWRVMFKLRWFITGLLSAALAFMLIKWFSKNEKTEWVKQSWYFAKQIMPLLLLGVIAAGFLLGRPGNEGLIPSVYVENAVGGNSLLSNFFASILGAFMYFATLTEIPILQGLIGAGMGKGPSLALLLAGPALSLPNMLVIRGVIGTRKTVTYVLLVVVMATLSGVIFGAIVS